MLPMLQTHFKDEADKAFPVYEEVRELLEEDDINEEYSDEDDDVCSDLEGKPNDDLRDSCQCLPP